MDTCFPDWSNQIGVDFPVPNYKKPFRSDSDLVELLWQNGELILQSQNNRKLSRETDQELPKQDQSVVGASGNPSSDLILNNETVTWADFPIDECFEKEFCSTLLPQIQSVDPDPVGSHKISALFGKEKINKIGGASNFDQDVPKTQQQVFAKPPEQPLRFESSGARIRTSGGKNLQISVEKDSRTACKDVREQTVMTVGSSHCASNQVITHDVDMSWASNGNICSRTFKENYAWLVRPEHEVTERDTLDQAITSSSDGSFCKTNDQLSNDTSRLKRKMKDVEESEQRSEATELESASRNKSSQKSGITRKSRVAEVHNLSERRRRDRINEKMRALQELIPHSTKSDKASMLDEAIEYMKSLQLQLQLLWMGSGMTPVMLPGMQHYMSRLGMVGPQTIPSLQNLVRLSRLPLVDQALTIAPTMNHKAQMIPQNQAQMFGPISYQNQMQNSISPEQYAANCMGFQGFQNSQQPMNMFNLGSQSVQQNHVPAPPGNDNGSVA